VDKPAANVDNSDKAEEHGEGGTEQETSSTSKLSKKKSKKEDKWKQKMMFLYEDGANPDEDVGETGSTETEPVGDSKYMNVS